MTVMFVMEERVALERKNALVEVWTLGQVEVAQVGVVEVQRQWQEAA